MLTRVKICGLGSASDARAAALAGADYAGVILHAESPRVQALDAARAIHEAAAPARSVGVFVDAEEAKLHASIDALGLEVIQLHGDEPVALVDGLRASTGVTVWKAVRPRTSDEFARALDTWLPRVDGLLVDGWSAAGPGGTGTRFDWAMVAALRERIPEHVRFIVAGGLRDDNVAEAIEALRPDVVDVSSGVEASPGRKSPDRMRAFVRAARAVEAGRAS